MGPVVTFKHIDPEFADAFATGASIQVGTFASYREGEGARVDPLEGRTVNHIGYFHASQPTGGPGVIDLPGGATIVGCGEVIIKNVTTSPELLPAFIFCASTQPDEALRKAGQAIFRITDLLAFAEALAAARPDILRNPKIGKVQYVTRAVRSDFGLAALPQPFAKDPRFAAEKEVRIVWQTTGRPMARVQIDCPAAAEYIKLV